MNEQEQIAALAAKLNVFDCFNAIMYGVKHGDGKRFIDLYAEACRLRGDKVDPAANPEGGYEITPKERL